MRKSLLVLAVLAVCIATVLAAERGQDKKNVRNEETCEGELNALRNNYFKSRKDRAKQIALIKRMLRIVSHLRSVKLQENVEEDVETERHHKEAHGKGGVRDILRNLIKKIQKENAAELRSLAKKKSQCNGVCVRAVRGANGRYKSVVRALRAARTAYNRAVRAKSGRLAAWRSARGGLIQSKRTRTKESKRLRRELQLINYLISYAARLTGIAFPKEAISQLQEAAKASDDFKEILEEVVRSKGGDVAQVRALLKKLKAKILRQIAALTSSVNRYVARQAAAKKAYRRSVHYVNSMHRRLVRARRAQAKELRRLRAVKRQCGRISRKKFGRRLVQEDVDEGVDVDADADVETDGGEDAMLMGLLSALSGSSGKKGGDMTKLLSALAGKADVEESDDTDMEDSDDDVSPEDVDEDDDNKNKKNLDRDIKKVYKVAKSTKNIKKIAAEAKKRLNKHKERN